MSSWKNYFVYQKNQNISSQKRKIIKKISRKKNLESFQWKTKLTNSKMVTMMKKIENG
jgi:hypothetical protein